MECPKCGFRKMQQQNTISSPSGIINDGTQAGLIQGNSCIMCGAWVELDTQPVCSYHPRQEKNHSDVFRKGLSVTAGVRKINEYDHLVWKYQNKVDNLFRIGTEIDVVTRTIMNIQKTFSSFKRVKAAIGRYRSGRMKEVMDAAGIS